MKGAYLRKVLVVALLLVVFVGVFVNVVSEGGFAYQKSINKYLLERFGPADLEILGTADGVNEHFDGGKLKENEELSPEQIRDSLSYLAMEAGVDESELMMGSLDQMEADGNMADYVEQIKDDSFEVDMVLEQLKSYGFEDGKGVEGLNSFMKHYMGGDFAEGDGFGGDFAKFLQDGGEISIDRGLDPTDDGRERIVFKNKDGVEVKAPKDEAAKFDGADVSESGDLTFKSGDDSVLTDTEHELDNFDEGDRTVRLLGEEMEDGKRRAMELDLGKGDDGVETKVEYPNAWEGAADGSDYEGVKMTGGEEIRLGYKEDGSEGKFVKTDVINRDGGGLGTMDGDVPLEAYRVVDGPGLNSGEKVNGLVVRGFHEKFSVMEDGTSKSQFVTGNPEKLQFVGEGSYSVKGDKVEYSGFLKDPSLKGSQVLYQKMGEDFGALIDSQGRIHVPDADGNFAVPFRDPQTGQEKIAYLSAQEFKEVAAKNGWGELKPTEFMMVSGAGGDYPGAQFDQNGKLAVKGKGMGFRTTLTGSDGKTLPTSFATGYKGENGQIIPQQGMVPAGSGEAVLFNEQGGHVGRNSAAALGRPGDPRVNPPSCPGGNCGPPGSGSGSGSGSGGGGGGGGKMQEIAQAVAGALEKLAGLAQPAQPADPGEPAGSPEGMGVPGDLETNDKQRACGVNGDEGVDSSTCPKTGCTGCSQFYNSETQNP